MSQSFPIVNAITNLFFCALVVASCLVWCVIVKAVGGLVGVCTDVVVPLVLRSSAWEDAGDSFECRNDYNVEAGSFSYTPEAAPVGNTGTTPRECAWQVQHTCTSTFSLAVTSRSHYRESSQGRSGSRDSVHYEHSLVEAASSVDVDDSLVVSEAQIPVVANPDEALDDVEVAQATEASQGAENDWSTIQADSLYFESMEVEDLPLVDPMVIDPWWWQGVVTFEYTPEAMDVDAPVEGGLGGADLDQPAQVMGDVEMQENSGLVEFEDVVMVYAYLEAEPIVQNNMEAEVHSDRGVEPELHVANAREEALVPEGDRSVVSSAPETREERDVVLNRGAAVDLPTLPSSEVLNQNNTVLPQAPVENQGSSEDRSGSAESSRSVEQHPAGCQCATCAAVAIDLEEVRRFFDLFEEEDEEEQEQAQEEDRVLRNRTGGRSRLLGRR